MSQLTKSVLGPARSTACTHCGKRVSVSWWAVLAVVPFLAALWLAPHLGHLWAAALAIAVGIIATFCIHAFLVPLVPRGT